MSVNEELIGFYIWSISANFRFQIPIRGENLQSRQEHSLRNSIIDGSNVNSFFSYWEEDVSRMPVFQTKRCLELCCTMLPWTWNVQKINAFNGDDSHFIRSRNSIHIANGINWDFLVSIFFFKYHLTWCNAILDFF